MKELELIPITLRNKDDELYERSPEVESQIREALTLDRKRLIERANQKDYGSDDYFPPECLVYLIRAYRRNGESEIAEKLLDALIDRCKKKIDSTLRDLLSPYYVNECFQEVIDEVIVQLFDGNTDKADFAQIRFWLWLHGIICNVRRKYFKFQTEDSVTGNYEREFKSTQTDIGDAVERKNGLAKARKLLTDREFQIYVMRYTWGWQIHSDDQSVMTISKYFNVTARAIHKWFEKAEEKLRNGS